MTRFSFLLLFLFSLTMNATPDWGKNGHRTVGAIAEAHLSKKAQKAIDKLLNGKSLALVSTFGDEIRSDKKYRSFAPWHYVSFPFEATYDTHPKSEKGDVITGINTCIEKIKDENSTREDKAFYLKMLVHFIGDIHQPLHVGLAEDKGGNTFQVQWFDQGTNLHSVWDTKIIESYEMSYTELADNRKRLTKAEIATIQLGDAKTWAAESRELCKDIYANTKPGENLGYRYMFDYMDVTRTQLQKGGIRLATVLNEIFG
ncbi:putative S1/P1 Nuclease [unidentified eubacterium SCB49]|nr:putative S1/P1 Nuclease [unidentified eubacterium SCB49]